MKTSLKKSIEGLTIGDLVCCSWCDASTGKSRSSGLDIDIPVKSWGIFVGLIGDRIKHIVLAQNSFRYSDSFFDLDYTAIPLSWAIEVTVLSKDHIPKDIAIKLVNSFMTGGCQTLTRTRISRATHFRLRLSIDDNRPN